MKHLVHRRLSQVSNITKPGYAIHIGFHIETNSKLLHSWKLKCFGLGVTKSGFRRLQAILHRKRCCCRERAFFAPVKNLYAFLFVRLHRKLRRYDTHILCKLEFKRYSGHVPPWHIFLLSNNFLANSFVLYIPLRNPFIFVLFLFLKKDKGQDPLSIRKLNPDKLNQPNTISENYVQQSVL